jgi:hypothetical protein
LGVKTKQARTSSVLVLTELSFPSCLYGTSIIAFYLLALGGVKAHRQSHSREQRHCIITIQIL